MKKLIQLLLLYSCINASAAGLVNGTLSPVLGGGSGGSGTNNINGITNYQSLVTLVSMTVSNSLTLTSGAVTQNTDTNQLLVTGFTGAYVAGNGLYYYSTNNGNGDSCVVFTNESNPLWGIGLGTSSFEGGTAIYSNGVAMAVSGGSGGCLNPLEEGTTNWLYTSESTDSSQTNVYVWRYYSFTNISTVVLTTTNNNLYVNGSLIGSGGSSGIPYTNAYGVALYLDGNGNIIITNLNAGNGSFLSTDTNLNTKGTGNHVTTGTETAAGFIGGYISDSESNQIIQLSTNQTTVQSDQFNGQDLSGNDRVQWNPYGTYFEDESGEVQMEIHAAGDGGLLDGNGGVAFSNELWSFGGVIRLNDQTTFTNTGLRALIQGDWNNGWSDANECAFLGGGGNIVNHGGYSLFLGQPHDGTIDLNGAANDTGIIAGGVGYFTIEGSQYYLLGGESGFLNLTNDQGTFLWNMRAGNITYDSKSTFVSAQGYNTSSTSDDFFFGAGFDFPSDVWSGTSYSAFFGGNVFVSGTVTAPATVTSQVSASPGSSIIEVTNAVLLVNPIIQTDDGTYFRCSNVGGNLIWSQYSPP